jgi:hypothetical protein
MFLPLQRMRERVEVARESSDTDFFFSLLYLGEMVLKTATAGIISGIGDDPDRHRYRELHRLVRADGLGEWCTAIDEILVGTASQHLIDPVRTEQRELTQKVGYGEWQFSAVSKLHECLKSFQKVSEPLPAKVEGRRWFPLFAEMRNKTRAHGAPSGTTCRRLSPQLEESIWLFVSHLFLFRREWAYLHRSLSGKYRVTKLSESVASFEPLKKAGGSNNWGSLQDGVYIFYDRPTRVDLIQSDAEALDFLFANGNFNGKRYELISYITDNRADADALPYLPPASELPPSATQGAGLLDVQGNVFGNLPPRPPRYIKRRVLEVELEKRVLDDRHPVITLVGPGGDRQNLARTRGSTRSGRHAALRHDSLV